MTHSARWQWFFLLALVAAALVYFYGRAHWEPALATFGGGDAADVSLWRAWPGSVWAYLPPVLLIIGAFIAASPWFSRFCVNVVGKRMFIVVAVIGVAATVFLESLIIDLHEWSREMDSIGEESALAFFADFAEGADVIITVLFAFIAASWILFEYSTQMTKRQRTARFWISYNTSNRLEQDEAALDLLCKIVSSDSAIETMNEDELKDAQIRAFTILNGFQATWKNDDIMSESIAFEFNLLTPREKNRVMRCFRDYNNLQDRISFVTEYLRPGDRDSGRFIGDALAREGLKEIPDICVEITARMKEARDLLTMIESHDRELVRARQKEEKEAAAAQAARAPAAAAP